ncbi:ATP-binding protein [Dyadobacter sandarakinus]|uniref:ATP-binding protein n=1 Tax=Dyadobacter sandarakinus TaxID=2747268 RepID=A0ABX7I404_9BACT|nr:ATP-binding protein [Dyadobacter sandarakinus]QRR00600.1 ATP-binding protein [Dyadobacter sandarakinus]
MASGFFNWLSDAFGGQKEAEEEQLLLPGPEHPGLVARPQEGTEGREPVAAPLPADPESNYPNLLLSLEYLGQVTDSRLEAHFSNGIFTFPDLKLYADDSPLYAFTQRTQLTKEEYVMLMAAMAPHLQPGFFEGKISRHIPKDGDFLEMGGIRGEHSRSMIPTGETVLFLLAGPDTGLRLQLAKVLFSNENPLLKEHVVTLEESRDGEPGLSGRLTVSRDYLALFTSGETWRPRFGPSFPAKFITTTMTWEDLVLPEGIRAELDQIYNWLHFNERLLEDPALKARLKPGYRALFYGPPGTGKTLAATLLGQRLGKDVYRIDLSLIVSKYIGETEKNLQTLFDVAENRNWILFFDEADALFGKRISVSSSNDRYANQEVSYLLQRIEDYNGLVILASNFRNNLDPAFTRRFQSMVSFTMPGVSERRLLWEQTFPASLPASDDISFDELARNFELSGAAILNVVQLAGIQACATRQPLSKSMLVQEIRKEYAKESKTM